MPWKKQKIVELTEAEWGYVAGIIDGEGCLGVYTRSRQMMGSRQITSSRSFRPRLSIGNTSFELLYWLQACFGGYLRVVPSHNTTGHWKDYGILNLQNVQVIFEICRRTCPYLIVKRAQAELVLRFPFDIKCNQYTKELTLLTEETKNFLYQETLRLNKRGRED